MKKLLIPIVFSLAITVSAQEPVSQYSAALRQQASRSSAVADELVQMVRRGESNKSLIVRTGRKYLAEFDNARSVVETYKNARTRFGLQSEMDDMILMIRSIQEGRSALQTLSGNQAAVFVSNADASLARQAFETEIVPMIKDLVDIKLGSNGLADLLTDPGFRQAASIVSNRITADVRSEVEKKLRDLTGVRIKLNLSLRDHIIHAARSFVGRRIDNMILRFAANHLFVEVFAVRLLEWIGPKLKEMLRPKGNLEARTARAIEGMRQRRNSLNAMTSSADMLRVRRIVAMAEDHVKANNYLRGDLERARRFELLQKLKDEEVNLQRTVNLTKGRFLMNSQLAQEPLDEVVRHMTSQRAEIVSMLQKLESSISVAGNTPRVGGTPPRVVPPSRSEEFVAWLDPNVITCCAHDTGGEPNYRFHGTRASQVRPNALILGRFPNADAMKAWVCGHRIQFHFWEQTYARIGVYHVTRLPCPITPR